MIVQIPIIQQLTISLYDHRHIYQKLDTENSQIQPKVC